jgi:hypothetical protein
MFQPHPWNTNSFTTCSIISAEMSQGIMTRKEDEGSKRETPGIISNTEQGMKEMNGHQRHESQFG